MIDRQISLGGAILVVLKWTLISIAAMIAIGLAGWGIYSAWTYFSHDVHVAKIEPIVSAASNDCPNDYPIRIGFRNNSEKTVLKIHFALEARIPGHSTNIARYDFYSHDRITEPMRGWSTCYRATLDPAETARDLRSLNWSVIVRSVEFRE